MRKGEEQLKRMLLIVFLSEGGKTDLLYAVIVPSDNLKE